jgi:hypothetical protein
VLSELKSLAVKVVVIVTMYPRCYAALSAPR